jgi:PAT family beta-lactamase induction signal transducer AmpG
LSNLGYTLMAVVGLSTPMFAGVLFVENFSEGLAGAALVAYMSSLTDSAYTATQYALLSSFYALLGKVLKGFSGVIVESLARTMPLMEAYAWFFAGTATLAVPVIVLVAWLAHHTPAGVSSKT